MLKKLLLAYTFAIALSNCSDRTNDTNEVKEAIKGIWWCLDIDSTYFEVVISDSVYWMYHNSAGVIAYDYELTDNKVLRRYYKTTHDPITSLTVVKQVPDTIWIVADSGYELKLQRLKLGLDVDKIIDLDPAFVDRYIAGYRDRKRQWEEQSTH